VNHPNGSTFAIAIALLFLPSAASAQETPSDKKFFPVEISKEEIYSYNNLKFTGDFTSFESPSGVAALGRTEAGVTILVVLGGGNVTIEAPQDVHEKFKTVFGGYPLKAKFTTLYMRIHPKEFEDVFSKQLGAKVADDAAFAKAKELYDQKFLGSYHAGPLAIFPPLKTRFMDFEVPEIGQVVNEEGYWIFLRRFNPYGSVYPARFVNPKQK
jgi:hypothetical protein